VASQGYHLHMMNGVWLLNKDDKEFEQLFNKTFGKNFKAEYSDMFEVIDSANNITDTLKIMIEDDELWQEMANNKEDRAMFVATVGVMSMKFMEVTMPLADELFGGEDDGEDEEK
jgi:hypothetical protein